MNISLVEKEYSPINTTKFCYKVTTTENIIHIVPHNEANTDYQAIQEWAAIEGNNIIDPGA